MIMDFKTQEGQTKAMEIVKDIFCDFAKLETVFSDYGTMTVTADDIFEFSFSTEDNLLQTKRIITLLSLKKLENKNENNK